ncbi:MAG: hypothetical protein L0387_30370 [Acidobacteria bacterium]|nr:hypothetical protein [Acidobacteriota bacterium]
MKRTLPILAVFALLTYSRAVDPQISIDLTHATINDRPLAELTIDAVTDMLGRPTAIGDPKVKTVGKKAIVSGASLAYAEPGLTFLFLHQQQDSKQRLAAKPELISLLFAAR